MALPSSVVKVPSDRKSRLQISFKLRLRGHNIQNVNIKHKLCDVNKFIVQCQYLFSVLASLPSSAKERQDNKLGVPGLYRQFNGGCTQFF